MACKRDFEIRIHSQRRGRCACSVAPALIAGIYRHGGGDLHETQSRRGTVSTGNRHDTVIGSLITGWEDGRATSIG